MKHDFKNQNRTLSYLRNCAAILSPNEAVRKGTKTTLYKPILYRCA